MNGKDVICAVDLARHYVLGGSGMLRKRLTLKALDGVSFGISPGRTLAVVGESGCGKSTLARVVTMIEKPTGGRLRIGSIDSGTRDKSLRKMLRRQVQIIFQNPYGSLNPRKKVGAILEEPLRINTRLRAEERKDRVLDMMARVGLRPEQYGRYPHMFSGGQRQRIAVARALMLNPTLVVADEPVSALDVSVQAQTLNLLMDLQEEMHLAYLFISHDLSVVRHIADELMVMYLGRPVEQGEKEVIFQSPLHPYTRALLAAMPKVMPNERQARSPLAGEVPSQLNPPAGCAFHGRCLSMTAVCKVAPPVLRLLDGRWVACHHAEKAL